MVKPENFSKYERARIIGARGLQISMDAPLLLKMSNGDLEGANYDPLKLAERELDAGVLPISVNRPMPKKKEESLENVKIEDVAVHSTDDDKMKVEQAEEKDISDDGEILEFANPEEESDAVVEETEGVDVE